MNFYQLPNGEVAGFDDPDLVPEGATEIAADQFSQIATTPVLTLAQIKAARIAALTTDYTVAIQQAVSYTSKAGVTQTFQGDTDSQTRLMQASQGFGMAGATPPGFYWVAADNTQEPFTLEDLQGLYSVLLTRGVGSVSEVGDTQEGRRRSNNH